MGDERDSQPVNKKSIIINGSVPAHGPSRAGAISGQRGYSLVTAYRDGARVVEAQFPGRSQQGEDQRVNSNREQENDILWALQYVPIRVLRELRLDLSLWPW